MKEVLTAYVRGGLELGVHHGIHFDVHVLLVLHVEVALLHLGGDPGPERLADHGGADVDDPLLRRLREVLVVWEEGLDVGDVGDELENLLDAQTLVLGDVEVLDLVVLQVSLLLVQDVFEEVDRCVI